MFWKPFEYDDKIYDLSHLNETEFTYVQPAKGDNSEISYTANVYYSLHCFTRGKNKTGVDKVDLFYADSREERVFDFRRYRLSFMLPEIVRTLGERKCFHTGKGNFFTVEIVRFDGDKEEYTIYFRIERGDDKDLNLYVQSAYPRNEERQFNKPRKNRMRKKIGFYILLYNTYNNKPIKIPK